MAGLRLASTDGAGWTVETVELSDTSRRARRRERGGPSRSATARRSGSADTVT
jgi:hypothetical protein